MKIIIDPGHGGKDPGAIGNGLVEKDLTMFLAMRIEERLDKYECDAEIFQLPNVSAMEDLQTVIDAANDNKADFFLSLHINSVSDPSVNGFESFRYPGSTDKYQRMIHKAVADYLTGHGIRDRKAKEGNLKVLRETNMPSVLLEFVFLSSPHDAQILKNIKILDKLANEVAWGLVQALGLMPKMERSEIDKLTDELRRMKQEMKQMSGICSKYVAM